MSEEQLERNMYANCGPQAQAMPTMNQANQGVQPSFQVSPSMQMQMPQQQMNPAMPMAMPMIPMNQGVPMQGSVQGAMSMPTPFAVPVPQQQIPNIPGMLPIEQSYVENILRLNRGKMATVYMTFEGSREWNSKIFRGRIEAAGRDHIVLSDPETGKRYLLLMVYLDYVVFDEQINYEYPFDGVSSGLLSQYAPR